MRDLFKLFIVSIFLLSVACASHVKEKLTLHNHLNDYKTKAHSIPKMPPSKQFQYDGQYDIPEVEVGGSVDAGNLMIPPGSKH